MKNILENTKAVFIDLDGTLIDGKHKNEKYITSHNKKALIEWQKKGKEFIVSSGRIGESLFKYADEVSPDYIIGGNGSVIFDKEHNLLAEHKLSRRQILLILEIAIKYNLAMKLDDQKNIYGAISWIKRKILNTSPKFKGVPSYNFDKSREYYKVILWGKPSVAKTEEIRKLIIKKIPGISAVLGIASLSIEVTNENATKGLASKYILEHELKNKIRKLDAIHIGDTMNDSTTIGHVGNLVVMKNATSSVRKLASYIGPDYKAGGVAKVLNGEIVPNTKNYEVAFKEVYKANTKENYDLLLNKIGNVKKTKFFKKTKKSEKLPVIDTEEITEINKDSFKTKLRSIKLLSKDEKNNVNVLRKLELEEKSKNKNSR